MTDGGIHRAAAPAVPSAVRAKPDFGGVTSEHVEVSATGPTIEAAVNNAVRLAVEQVNGKVVKPAPEFTVETKAGANVVVLQLDDVKPADVKLSSADVVFGLN